jgi:hypothetical protein
MAALSERMKSLNNQDALQEMDFGNAAALQLKIAKVSVVAALSS